MKINQLPNELLDIIFSYLPDVSKMRLNKHFYEKYHKMVLSKLVKDCESYIRFMIRRDNDFIIKHLIKENYNRWIGFKNYYYNLIDFDDYICFLKYYSSENNSEKCENEIQLYVKMK